MSQSHSPLDTTLEVVDSSVPSSVVCKWLNVILDLNGILCVSKERRFLPKGQVYNLVSNVHSSVLPVVVDLKAVFVRPQCLDFLRNLNFITNVSV